MRLAICALVLIALAPSRASAHCGPFWVGAPPDGLVPPRGVVYLHAAWPEVCDTTVPGVAVSMMVSRVDLDGHPLAIVDPYKHTTRLVPFDGWRAPSDPPRVIGIDHREGFKLDMLSIAVDQYVAAFRIRWTFDGVTREHIEAAQNADGRSRVLFGRFGHGGAGGKIPMEQLHAGGHLELVAIRFDGSEVPVEGLPDELRLDMDIQRLLTCLGLLALLLFAPFAISFAPARQLRAPLPAARLVFRDQR